MYVCVVYNGACLCGCNCVYVQSIVVHIYVCVRVCVVYNGAYLCVCVRACVHVWCIMVHIPAVMRKIPPSL